MAPSADPASLTENQLRYLVSEVFPGNFNMFTRSQLLNFVAHHRSSRFEHLLTSSSVLRMVAKNQEEAAKAKRKAKQKQDTYRRLAGTQVLAPQYDVEVEFGDINGISFGNPLDIKSFTTYQCRMRLRQHQGEFNCIGFGLDWRKTGSLSWADGHSTRIYAEAISNPLVVTRLVRTGSVAVNTTASVKVVVAERYL